MHNSNPQPFQSTAAGPLKGQLRVPGDKSISHRSLMFGAIAVGETVVSGLLEGEDVIATADAMRALGAEIYKDDDGRWHIHGVGVGGFKEPDNVLDLGNSGTSARLMMGLVGTQPINCFFTGDGSLRGRPMGRVAKPLSLMGVAVTSREGGRLPLVVHGTDSPVPIRYTLPVASAQVKSAILLAGLNTPGMTTVEEPKPTRDHTERMLRQFGAEVEVEENGEGGRVISVTGHPSLTGQTIDVPGDPSSAAFPAVAAAILDGSEVTIEHVGVNVLRAGIFATLEEMGADITVTRTDDGKGEPVATITIKGGGLKGITVPPERAPSMIDEYPVLAVAAACAEGETVMMGLEELRVKESDRLAGICKGLKACGVELEELEDGVIIQGCGGKIPGGGTIETNLDHRMAMSFLIAGMNAEAPVQIDDATPINTSFPGFVDMMQGLGAEFSAV